MKKLLTLALSLALASCLGTASLAGAATLNAGTTTGNTTVTTSVQPTYTVTIPESLNIGYQDTGIKTLAVTPSGMLLDQGYLVKVSVSGSGTGNAFALLSQTTPSVGIPVQVSSQAGASFDSGLLTPGSSFAMFGNGATAASSLYVRIPSDSWAKATVAGAYSGSLNFTISYVQAIA